MPQARSRSSRASTWGPFSLSDGRPERSHFAVIVGKVSCILAASFGAVLAGIGVTSAWPSTVETGDYSAVVRLSALPGQASTLHAPTLFGDLDLRFSGWLPAPGVEALGQVRASITRVLASQDLSVAALQPTRAQMDATLSDAVLEVGLKFALGVLLTALLVALLVWGLGQHRGHRTTMRRLVGAPALVAVLALGTTALASWQTYRPARLTAVESTGLISTVRANTSLLADMQARASEATPYVKNMLAMSAALQDQFTPGDLTNDSPLKILLVSDIHGANQYALMKSIVESERITAVIDCGDLINFGRVQEAEAAGLFTGIQSLGVPYLFVRGNHDATSPTDQALIDRMRRVPGVIVLEPTPADYTVATVAGLRIAGFNDPRYWGDGGQNTAQAQVPAIEAFNRAFAADRQRVASTLRSASASASATPSSTASGSASTPAAGSAAATSARLAALTDASRGLDLLVGHEPAAVEGVKEAGIRINGHLHSDQLAGNRIGVGTFTGGGVVSHYNAGDGAELSGQPYAFDILAFTDTCRLATLTRYQFRDLVEGRPQFDDVRVINGATIQSPLPSAGRVCSTADAVQTTSVPAVGGAPAVTSAPAAP